MTVQINIEKIDNGYILTSDTPYTYFDDWRTYANDWDEVLKLLAELKKEIDEHEKELGAKKDE